MSKVLVVVPTLGTRPEWLLECVRSILNQRVDVLVRVVCPTGSVQQDQLPGSPNVEVLYSDKPGLSNALADGFSGWDNEFLTWLGDDDLLAPDTMQLVLAALAVKPLAPYGYGRTRYIDEIGRTIGVSRPGKLASRWLKFGKDFVPQPGSVIRTRAFFEAGGLDRNLKNAMDLDLFIRLSRIGEAVYVAAEVSAYRLHGSSITASKGSADEAAAVRWKHLTPRQRRTFFLWRPLTLAVDRVWDVANRRLPASAPRSAYSTQEE